MHAAASFFLMRNVNTEPMSVHLIGPNTGPEQGFCLCLKLCKVYLQVFKSWICFMCEK